ncbi:MAG: hypothetical protein IJY09_08885 [Lachnospiraceae bacterium]|nr:hypothetical protein [Lachnospiraceae bacterium]
MKSLKKKKQTLLRSVLIPILIFGVLIGVLLVGTEHFVKVNKEQGVALTEQAIRKAVLTCYAVEGMYPSTLEYLEEHYQLEIDEAKYYISYDCFASNIMPEIYVFER